MQFASAIVPTNELTVATGLLSEDLGLVATKHKLYVTPLCGSPGTFREVYAPSETAITCMAVAHARPADKTVAVVLGTASGASFIIEVAIADGTVARTVRKCQRKGSPAGITAVCFAHDPMSGFATLSSAGALAVWSTAGEPRSLLCEAAEFSSGLCFTSDDSGVVVGTDASLTVYSTRPGFQPSVIALDGEVPICVLVHGSLVYVGCESGEVHSVGLSSGKISSFATASGPVTSITGRRVLCVGSLDGSVHIYGTQGMLYSAVFCGGPVMSSRCSASGALLVGTVLGAVAMTVCAADISSRFYSVKHADGGSLKLFCATAGEAKTVEFVGLVDVGVTGAGIVVVCKDSIRLYNADNWRREPESASWNGEDAVVMDLATKDRVGVLSGAQGSGYVIFDHLMRPVGNRLAVPMGSLVTSAPGIVILAKKRMVSLIDERTGRSLGDPFTHSSSVVCAFGDMKNVLVLSDTGDLCSLRPGVKGTVPTRVCSGVVAAAWISELNAAVVITSSNTLELVAAPGSFSAAGDRAHFVLAHDVSSNSVVATPTAVFVGPVIYAIPKIFRIVSSAVEKGKAAEAMQAVRVSDVGAAWALLAAGCVENGDVELAAEAFLGLKLYHFSAYCLWAGQLSPELCTPHLLAMCGRVSEAESALLAGRRYFWACRLACREGEFRRALDIARLSDDHRLVGFVCRERTRYLSTVGITEIADEFLELPEPDPRSVDQLIHEELKITGNVMPFQLTTPPATAAGRSAMTYEVEDLPEDTVHAQKPQRYEPEPVEAPVHVTETFEAVGEPTPAVLPEDDMFGDEFGGVTVDAPQEDFGEFDLDGDFEF